MTDYDEARLADAMAWPRPSGIWRRLFASLIDYLIVLIALYSLIAILFLTTDGGVKGSFWLTWRTCQAATVHGDASLAPYNWQVCRTSVFDLAVAEWAVGTSPSSQSAETASISIDLDPRGNFRPAALNLGFLELVVLASYLLVMEWTSGQPIGKRVMAIAVHDQDDKERVGLPVRKAFRRQVMKFLGALPMTLSGGWYAFQAWGSAPGATQDFSKLEIAGAYAALFLTLVWPIWIAISIVLGNEPIHDRFAGTTVRVEEPQT
ncbi:RDD family protein [Mesorhizobium sp. dw_380]|uniref:RDD family protein n=1 Tax=Mesorhizobium sp. dw_380 TaxID=2812001 RepID=UPI001BDE8F32|nr:RDD family protein [Mesorhizobium sp. dw_380]